MRFVVVNNNPHIVSQFETMFSEIRASVPKDIRLCCFQGSLQECEAALRGQEPRTVPSKTALVAPANSLCFMGGGFDRAIAELFTGPGGDYRVFETAIQNHVLAKFNGFVPPQSAHVVDLAEACGGPGASGVRTNSSPASTFGATFGASARASIFTHLIVTPTMAVPEKTSYLTVFYATWNSLLAAKTIEGVETVIFPAFGAGFGGVSPLVVARTMCGAWGLLYMDMLAPAWGRGAAVLLFLRKDHRAFADREDVAKIESVLGKMCIDGDFRAPGILGENDPGPMLWRVLCRCISELGRV